MYFAQTNIQLFNQLKQGGYAHSDLSSVATAYKLAMHLFTGQFRSSGKTFIAHLVGTGSILAELGTTAQLVAAGILHACYTNGDFDKFRAGAMSQTIRNRYRQLVGTEVEAYVDGYSSIRWNTETIAAACSKIDAIEAIERNVLLMRLANELEEYSDCGLIYCSSQKYQRYMKRSDLVVDLAEKLRLPILAAWLRDASETTASSKRTVQEDLCNLTGSRSSCIIKPQSYRMKPTLYKRVFSAWLDPS